MSEMSSEVFDKHLTFSIHSRSDSCKKKVRWWGVRLILLNSSRRMSLGRKLCYTVFSQWGLSLLWYCDVFIVVIWSRSFGHFRFRERGHCSLYINIKYLYIVADYDFPFSILTKWQMTKWPQGGVVFWFQIKKIMQSSRDNGNCRFAAFTLWQG